MYQFTFDFIALLTECGEISTAMALDHAQCLALLMSDPSAPEAEEYLHPWVEPSSTTLQNYPSVGDRPLMRIRDCHTDYRPDEADLKSEENLNNINARNSGARLDTKELRNTALKNHTDYQNRIHTPFLSFTDCPSRIRYLANMRFERPNKYGYTRGSQILTLINPKIRLEKGLPILNAKEELQRYNVGDFYNKDYDYNKDEYLCLWGITEDEIVSHYNWEELRKDPKWYQNTVMRDFKAHRVRYPPETGSTFYES